MVFQKKLTESDPFETLVNSDGHTHMANLLVCVTIDSFFIELWFIFKN